jgi:hypothetical protein
MSNKTMNVNNPKILPVGIIGGTSSGKTTYLAALKIASLLDNSGSWSISGLDAGSIRFLADTTSAIRSGYFPREGTTTPQSYTYRISGQPRQNRDFFSSLIKGKTRPVNMTLQVNDYPGDFFLKTDPNDDLWKHLAGCLGFVYLFDLELESTRRINFDYLQLVIDFVKQTRLMKNATVDDRLPHFIAVALSKYDDPATYAFLRKHNLVGVDSQDPRCTPVVLDVRRAIQLVDPLMVRLIENNFLLHRIAYFAVSSIGFYAPPEQKINPEDCSNVIVTPSGKRIRSGKDTVPVKVINPLLWIDYETA